MRICVTRRGPSPDCGQALRDECLRSAAELAPELALPSVIKLRYGMAAGLFVLVLVGKLSLSDRLVLAPLLIPIGITFGTNFALARAALSLKNPHQWLGAMFCLDTLCLTAILALTGGPTNPFTLLYLVQITLSAVILNRAWTWALGALSTAAFAFLFPFHRPFGILEPAEMGATESKHLVGMFVAFAVAAALITIFIGKVSEVLRRRELEVLALQRQLAKNDRLASLVTLAAGAAHELATPMATIAVVAKELEHCASTPGGDEEIREDARLVRSEVERCRLILQRMRGREINVDENGTAPVSVKELLSDTLAACSAADRARIRLEVSGELPEVKLPAGAVRRALVALLKNALEAAQHGPVVLGARYHDARIEFTIRDQGPGMEPAVLNRIAEPFFTTKEPGHGMGLGTFLVRLTAERLGGSLVFDSEPGKGTAVVLELPEHCAEEVSNEQR